MATNQNWVTSNVGILGSTPLGRYAPDSRLAQGTASSLSRLMSRTNQAWPFAYLAPATTQGAPVSSVQSWAPQQTVASPGAVPAMSAATVPNGFNIIGSAGRQQNISYPQSVAYTNMIAAGQSPTLTPSGRSIAMTPAIARQFEQSAAAKATPGFDLGGYIINAGPSVDPSVSGYHPISSPATAALANMTPAQQTAHRWDVMGSEASKFLKAEANNPSIAEGTPWWQAYNQSGYTPQFQFTPQEGAAYTSALNEREASDSQYRQQLGEALNRWIGPGQERALANAAWSDIRGKTPAFNNMLAYYTPLQNPIDFLNQYRASI